MGWGVLSPGEFEQYTDSLDGKNVFGETNAVVGAAWGSVDAGESDAEICEVEQREIWNTYS